MKFDEAIIFAFIKKQLPLDEMEKYNALMLSSSEFNEKVNQVKNICDFTETYKKQKMIDTTKAWSKISRKIRLRSIQIKVWNITKTTAAVLFPLLLLYQFVIQPMFDNREEEMVTLISAPGIVTNVVLPDGSKVWLNAQSELTYPSRFRGKERNVSLSGEAYFQVVSNSKNRFNVMTADGITVSAFGTEFNVNSYREEVDNQVTLISGNVEVGIINSNNKKVLAEGSKAILTPMTGEMKILNADTYVDTAWKDGKMVFRRERLDNIAQKLSRKYGVTIKLEGDVIKEIGRASCRERV